MKNILLLTLLCVSSAASYAQIIFGINNYTEYHHGTLPIVISVPHGGVLTPLSIPDRTCNNPTLVTDGYTISLAKQIDSSLFNLTGQHPHVIYCNLKRTKIDCNREIIEGACGNTEAITAWNEFHHFIDTAEAVVQTQYPAQGFYIDLHGHGHTIQQLELGYLYSSTSLSYTDSVLNIAYYKDLSSIKNLVASNVNAYTNAQMLRGEFAFGTLIANAGFPAVPSLQTPSPGTNPYFDGGYNTVNYTCHAAGNSANGMQIECNSNVRSTYANRKVFADSLAAVLIKYFLIHENLNLIPCSVAIPLITASGATTFCQGNSITLTSSTAGSYLWNNGATTQSITISTSGNYTVTVSIGTGCSASSNPTTVTVNSLPTASVITTSGSTTVCPGSSVLLSGNSTGGSWSVVGGTTSSLTATASGDYFVTTLNSCGSVTSNHIIVTIACLQPTNISVSGITGTKATIAWTGQSCAYKYELQYRKQPSITWINKATSGTTKSLTNLTAASIYEYRLRTDCNSTGSVNSGYTIIRTFSTVAAKMEEEASSETNPFEITLSPNPALADLSLRFTTNHTTVQITIVNAIGQIVFSQSLYAEDGRYDAHLDVKTLSSGMYFLLIETSDGVSQKKFVKQQSGE